MPLSNAEIADRLASLAQLLAAHSENGCKEKAYRRAANKIRTLGTSVEELVRANADLTQYEKTSVLNCFTGAIVCCLAMKLARAGLPA